MTAQAKMRHSPRSQRPRNPTADGKNQRNRNGGKDGGKRNRTSGARMHNFESGESKPWEEIKKESHQAYADWKHAKDLYDAAHSAAARHNLTNDGGGR